MRRTPGAEAPARGEPPGGWGGEGAEPGPAGPVPGSAARAAVRAGVVWGVPGAAAVLALVGTGLEQPPLGMAGALLWMAAWWIAEVAPLAVTALLPLVLFPLFGVLGSKATAKAYFNDTLALFLGSFVVALAVQKHQLHRRLALNTLALTGTRPSGVLLGCILAPFLLSMWISNTATTAMMVPMAMTMVDTLVKPKRRRGEPGRGAAEGAAEGANGNGAGKLGPTEDPAAALISDVELTAMEDGAEVPTPGDGDQIRTAAAQKFARGLVLGVAYGSNLGGMATLIGTAANGVLAGLWQEYRGEPLSFGAWMLFAAPLACLLMLVLWGFSCFHFVSKEMPTLDTSQLRKDIALLGPMSYAEKTVVAVFSAMALLWVSREGPLGGWADLFDDDTRPSDAVPSIGAAVLLFLLPAEGMPCGRRGRAPPERILVWEDMLALPWSVVLLMGGGFAISEGLKGSGTMEALKDGFMGDLAGLPPLVLPLVVASIVTVMTEVTSNVATASIFLPVFFEAAKHPAAMVLPTTLACSLAFMLPNATPPNAIAFSTGVLEVRHMLLPGLFLNAVGAFSVAFWCSIVGPALF